MAYEHEVPHVDITVELRCMWFDDLWPALEQRPMELSAEAFQAVRDFHQYFAQRAARLPESKGTVRNWLSSPVWRKVMNKAQITLDLMQIDNASC